VPVIVEKQGFGGEHSGRFLAAIIEFLFNKRSGLTQTVFCTRRCPTSLSGASVWRESPAQSGQQLAG